MNTPTGLTTDSKREDILAYSERLNEMTDHELLQEAKDQLQGLTKDRMIATVLAKRLQLQLEAERMLIMQRVA